MGAKTLRRRILLVPEGSLYLAFRLPRLIRQAGWEVDLLCERGDPLARSRYVSASIEETNQEAVLGQLQRRLLQKDHPWQAVIIAHEGIARRLTAQGGAEILSAWQPGAMRPPVREFLLSKFGLATVFQNGAATVPPARVCGSMQEIAAFGRSFGWPVMVKPPDQAGGVGVAKFTSPEELASAQASLTLPILAQKFIQGRRGVVDMVCSAGRPLAWLASYSIKQRHGEFGASTARQFRAMPKLAPLVEQVAQFTQFEGFCGFDWIEEEATGRHYLIEFHPRPPSGFRFGHFCGVDFARAVAAWLNREESTGPALIQPAETSVAAHYFSVDLMRCLRERDWPGLKHWLPGSGACHDFFWDDPALFAAWMLQGGRRLGQACLAGGRAAWSRTRLFHPPLELAWKHLRDRIR